MSMPLLSAILLAMTALGSAQTDPCRRVLECRRTELMDAIARNDIETICAQSPIYEQCLQDVVKVCTDPRKQVTLQRLLDTHRNSLQYLKCNTQNCVDVFRACLSPEARYNYEHGQTEKLCQQAPGVMTCMESALKNSCKTLADLKPDKFAELNEYVEKMKQKVRSCEDNSGNSGKSALASVLVSGLALFTALLLHRC